MHSFQNDQILLPPGAVWLMNSISEFKGRQELYLKQSPQVLRHLTDMALIESAESSNRIEGITVEKDRLKPLVLGNSKPHDRSEEEIAGYRKALNLIHAKYKNLRISSDVIKELHRLCKSDSWDAGQWKEKDNDIIRKHSDGRIEVIFKPVSAKDTPAMIEKLCLSYEHSVDQLKYPDLYAIACLILDFLSIHPFRDGNGRVSRLLTTLALYQHHYQIGKYISLERIIEQSKETYYEALNKSSQKWHQAQHDILPWLSYFLGTIFSAYKELEERAKNISSARGTKSEIIIDAINKQIGEFTLADIKKECPSVSQEMIKLIFQQQQRAGNIRSLGKGRAAKWQKINRIIDSRK